MGNLAKTFIATEEFGTHTYQAIININKVDDAFVRYIDAFDASVTEDQIPKLAIELLHNRCKILAVIHSFTLYRY